VSGEGAEPQEARASLSGPLPDPVRARVVALTADALGRMPPEQVPGSLKRVASFAPGRRARLAGSQIASVLETDEEFRQRVAIQARTTVSEVAEALESGATPLAADPVEVAAVAYLLRPEGWVGVVERSAGAADVERAADAGREAEQQVARMRKQLDEVTEELRKAREKSKAQIATLKDENAQLRHKLGETRHRLKAAQSAEADAQRAEAEAQAAASSAAAASDAEIRRLRTRADELERELAVGRRGDRAEKEAGTLRARLLLDTLLDSVQGLRRELALPAVEGAPADSVEADVAEQGSRTSSGHGSLAPDDPGLLNELLNLPRVHLIVDGYNVTKHAWPESPLERQRDRLMKGLAPLVARTRADVTVVFDAAETADRPPINKPRGVRVLFSPVGVIADDVIRQLVAVEPAGRPLVVVSSDQEVVRDVTKAGARAVASPALSALLAGS
jgi:predicted RNA-binding protein with PIN domain